MGGLRFLDKERKGKIDKSERIERSSTSAPSNYASYVSDRLVRQLFMNEDKRVVVEVLKAMIVSSKTSMREIRKLHAILKFLGIKI